jgi:hypothetical protein
VSLRDTVISFSAKGRISFAFIKVVLMRSWVKSAMERFLSVASLWALVRPSFRPLILCRTGVSPVYPPAYSAAAE